MKHTAAHLPMMDHMLAGLRDRGYGVEAVACDRRLIAAPMVSRLTARFGHGLVEYQGVAGHPVEVSIDLCGNLGIEQLRCWRIVLVLGASQGCRSIILDVALTVAGDVDGRFVRREGAATSRMLKSAFADLRETLTALKVARRGQTPHDPVAIVDIGVSGGLATGRSGLARRADGCPFVLAEARTTLLAICDRSPHIIADIQAICADVLARCEASSENAVRPHPSPMAPAVDQNFTPSSSGEVAVSTNNRNIISLFNASHTRGRHVR